MDQSMEGVLHHVVVDEVDGGGAKFAILECERNEHIICSGMIAKWMGLSDGNTVNREFQVFRKCPHDAME